MSHLSRICFIVETRNEEMKVRRRLGAGASAEKAGPKLWGGHELWLAQGGSFRGTSHPSHVERSGRWDL